VTREDLLDFLVCCNNSDGSDDDISVDPLAPTELEEYMGKISSIP
jgi:hypothetical protein